MTDKHKPVGRAVANLTEQHKALHEFEGEWNLEQKMFMGPHSAPMVAHGKTTCRVLVNGLVVFMESELDNGYKAVVMSTWNLAKGHYDGVFLDVHSFDGFDPLVGVRTSGLPVAAHSKHDMSDAALLVKGGPVRERVWTSRLTVPRMAALASGAPGVLAGVDAVPVQIVEHKISVNAYALACVNADINGEMFVMMENLYTR